MEKASFIDSEKFWKGRKVKESLYISAQNPSKVVDAKVILNLEKGLELDPMWGFFLKRTIQKDNGRENSYGCKIMSVIFLWSFQFFELSRDQLEFACACGSCSEYSMMKPG